MSGVYWLELRNTKFRACRAVAQGYYVAHKDPRGVVQRIAVDGQAEAQHMCAVLNAIEAGHTWTLELQAVYETAVALGEWARRCEGAL